jgi:hypothetical protein
LKKTIAVAITLCVSVLTVRAAIAQAAVPTAFDATTKAPALVYESPLAGFVPLSQTTVSPASTWREVNRAVGSYDSMSATMDDMPGMAGMAGMAAPAAAGAKPSMPMGHDVKSMPMKSAMPMKKAKSKKMDMPMKMDMPTKKNMPMKMDMPMNMDSMPGMSKEMK